MTVSTVVVRCRKCNTPIIRVKSDSHIELLGAGIVGIDRADRLIIRCWSCKQRRRWNWMPDGRTH